MTGTISPSSPLASAARCQGCHQVATVNESTQAPTDSQTRSLLELLRSVLESHAANKPLPPATVLERLASVFGAEVVGVAAPLEGTPLVQHRWPAGTVSSGQRLPWEDQPQ